LGSIGPNNQRTSGKEAVIEIFRIEARTVKEEIGPGIYRYRNFNEHIKIASFNNELEPTNETTLNINVNGDPGRYVAVCQLKNGFLRCSDSVLLAGEARARYPIRGRDGFNISTDKETYLPGETATLALEAPFGGKAWVSIEADKIIDQFVVDLKHNASKIEVPISKDHYPNAFVTVYLIRPGGQEKIPSERFGRVELNVIRKELNLDVNVVMDKSQIEPRDRGSGTIIITSNGKPIANADLTVMAVDEAVLKLGAWELPPLIPRFYRERRHNVATYHALDNHIEGFEEEDVTEKGFLIGGGGMDMQQQKKRARSNFLARAFWMTGLRTDDQGKVGFKFQAPDNLTSFRVTAVAQTKDHKFGKGQSHFEVSKRLMIEPALPRFIRNNDEIVFRAIARQKVMDNAKVLISCEPGEGIMSLEKEQYEIGPLNKNIPGTFNLRAKVKEGISEVTVLFKASILGNSKITDEVEIKLPVLRPGIIQRTGTYGKVPQNETEFVFSKSAPEIWEKSEGDFGITFSRSPFLPKLQGLPELLEYPHGCFEQRTSKLLGYIQLADMLQYLPALGQKHKNYRSTIEEGVNYIAKNLNNKGFLPYWSGSSSSNSYVTIQAAWLVNECKKLSYKIPPGLDINLEMALNSIIQGRTNDHADLRAFAVFIDSKSRTNKKPINAIEELYLNRNLLRDESRAFLALTMHAYKIMPEEIQLLASEIGNLSPKEVFDPGNFYSTSRSDAVKYIALNTISNAHWKEKSEPAFRKQILSVMDDSRNLSTQENLWLLMSIRSMMEKDNYEPFKEEIVKADLISKNQLSVAWKKQPLTNLNAIKLKNDNHPTYYLANASVLRDEENSKREDRGIRIERVIQNLTDAKRTGTPENPLKIGDEVLITYRLLSERDHFFVAVTDELAASLEVVNFNLAQVAAFYSLPNGINNQNLHLDHSELRDSSANLYFNRLKKGESTYSLLARVSSAGQFNWPACTITPMYEPRFNGLGNKTTLFVDYK
ncbi:MAG: alpha-2-macroglobulin family protein, partial [Verrucomicrobiales bacterium]|nr:alpha-2-macroglobulin family protein [Verrucomicrobiales bacterium]